MRVRRMLVPLLAMAGVLALVTPVASADDGGAPGPAAAGAIQAGGLQPARRGEIRQIGPGLPARPPLPLDSGSGRRVVYCNSCQYLWIVEADETIVRSYSVSGRQFMPGAGTYRVFVKQRYTFATHNPTITWEYMVAFSYGPNGGGIGFHEIPWQYGHPVQTEDQLGQFLSGGCVRQAHDDAVFMWDWADIGTTVLVTP